MSTDIAAPHTVPTLQYLSLSDLHESPLNPRRHWPAQAMEELVKSIQHVGVLTPILARRNATGYEIAAGHRRYRAAQTAGLTTVPVLTRDMSDQEFMEVLTIENLHREDIHPLDEAVSYRALMEKLGYDVPTLAGKVEKSESYIYQRLKLLELIPPVQEAFLKDDLTVGHAVLIARLQPADQHRVMSECVQPVDRGERKAGAAMISVRHLEHFIRTEVMLDLHAARFKKDDATLLPKAGACATCHKRTGFNVSLFNDIQSSDLCTDGRCFNAKLDAFLERKKAELQDAGKAVVELVDFGGPYEEREQAIKQGAKWDWEVTKVSKHTKGTPPDQIKTGLIVVGPDRGKTMSVVVPENKSGRHDGRSPKEIAAERARKKAERLNQQNREFLYFAVAQQLEYLEQSRENAWAIEMVARHIWDRLSHDGKRKYCQVFGVEAKVEKQSWGGTYADYSEPIAKTLATLGPGGLYGFCVKVLLVDALDARLSWSKDDPDPLHQVARRVGVKPEAFAPESSASKAEQVSSKPKKNTVGTDPQPDPAPTKKPRGRPKKKGAKASTQKATPAAGSTSPKKRGRPRKS